MVARLLADAVLVLHLAFIAFAVLGGFAVAWRPRLALLHLPCVSWAVFIELSAGICPLTPIEQRLRLAAGQSGYEGSFVDHYLAPLIYPPGLTYSAQLLLAAAVLLLNAAIYGTLVLRWRHRPPSPTSS
ncbi:MAG TPA: DUF2784 domain-containing protein [Burkholderiaceae bacterium]|nr:DUF2784 domain-containing protein [Burkholderiaceae bacterium]